MSESTNPYRSPVGDDGTGRPPDGKTLAGPRHEDPIVSTARRESLVVLATWLVALAWTVGYCVRYGYITNGYDVSQMKLVLGIPDWIFWGILTPWFTCYLFSNWFCLIYMKDADLGVENSDETGEAADAI
ncbi:MAG: hypothetical protein AB7O62_12915 [Pirellulales bacterium]